MFCDDDQRFGMRREQNMNKLNSEYSQPRSVGYKFLFKCLLWQSFEWFFRDIQQQKFTCLPSCYNRLLYSTRIQSLNSVSRSLGLKFEKKKFINKIFFLPIVSHVLFIVLECCDIYLTLFFHICFIDWPKMI